MERAYRGRRSQFGRMLSPPKYRQYNVFGRIARHIRDYLLKF